MFILKCPIKLTELFRNFYSKFRFFKQKIVYNYDHIKNTMYIDVFPQNNMRNRIKSFSAIRMLIDHG